MNITMKVLVVDDSISIRERLIVMLGEIENVEVVGQTQDVSEAITMIRALRPAVVVLDIGLAEGNGFDVLQALQQEAINPVVVMLTNYVAAQYRQRALQWGVRYFFDKSSEFRQVSETLRSLAASSDFDSSRGAQTGDFYNDPTQCNVRNRRRETATD
jgi:two-component system response regulator DevR